MNNEIIEFLRKDKTRFQTKGLFGDERDSLSIRIPGRDELVLTTPNNDTIRTVGFEVKTNDAAGLHAAIYRARPDAGAILVGRTRWSGAIPTIGTAVPTLYDEQARHIGKTARPVAAGKQRRLLRALKDGANIAIYGEQRVCIGTTPDRVVFNAELFEKCAKAYVVAKASGQRIQKVPKWVQLIAGARLHKDQKRAAESYEAGRIPEGMDAY